MLLGAASAAPPSPPPPPAVRSVVETHFGVTVRDPYRYFEDPSDPGLATYFRRQSAYTRAVLDALPGRPALLRRIAQLDAATQSVPVVVPVRGALFIEKRPPGANVTRLYARPIAGGPERLVLDPDRFAKRGQHYTIDYFSPSPDARYVAVGVSEGGSEETVLHVVDARTGALLGDTIEHAIYVPPSWRPDARSFYYFRTPSLPADAPQSARDTEGAAHLHVVGRDPARDPAIFGYRVSRAIPFAAEDVVSVNVNGVSSWAIASVAHGVQNELEIWAAPASLAVGPRTPWRKVVSYADAVTDFAFAGDTLYLSSHRGASRHRVLAVDLRRGSLAHARVAVPASPRVIEQIALARDGLYVRDLQGGLSAVRRLALRADGTPRAIRAVQLPSGGAINVLTSDPSVKGAFLQLQSWTESPRWYRVSPDEFRDTGVQPRSAVDYSAIVADETFATSADGTRVPLSIVRRRDLVADGSHPVLVDGYGAYGDVSRPTFSAVRLAWLERGAIFAECHPRGGGEYGEDWHFAAHIATKQRTIDDFVACAQALVAAHWTTPAKLAGEGTSAGGVTIGNAIVQHPELFAAALDVVGDTNAVRDEFSEAGPPNIPEFGTIANRTGWDALYATDAYLHIRDGVAYPAVLAMTGAKDPRVAPWIVAKFAARLQAATSSGKPVLLRVDFDAGHGYLGSSRTQAEQLAVDQYAFLLWQLGDPQFAPPWSSPPPASP
ncbi:MAG: prolyl oligopeptidase family serine peptidase [Candidatus Eremiobacteraeota bacterium]|nr:prolyl oligopeptidase family serine peptidase [Candidatus Eremiobacteraeota bacterium]